MNTIISSIRKLWINILIRIGYEHIKQEEVIATPDATQTQENKISHPKPRRKKDKSQTFSHETLSELLDNLDKTFDAYKIPFENLSWISKDESIGIRKLGAHVPNPWLMPWDKKEDDIFCNVKNGFPSFMCISLPSDSEDNVSSLKFMFGVKLKKLPIGVQKNFGKPYRFGYGVELDGKLFWFYMFVTINHKTGRITFCKEHTITTVSIPHPKENRPPDVLIRKVWKKSRLLDADFDVDGNLRTEDYQRIISLNWIRSVFNWWSSRGDRWSVSVKHKGEKVTFGVENKDTKKYFADRDKTVKAADGKAKRIIHQVTEHERNLSDGKKTTVREHIRGIREFDWNSYHCIVTAPVFHGGLSSSFDISSVELDADDDSIPNGFIGASKLGKVLSDFEEEDRRIDGGRKS